MLCFDVNTCVPQIVGVEGDNIDGDGDRAPLIPTTTAPAQQLAASPAESRPFKKQFPGQKWQDQRKTQNTRKMKRTADGKDAGTRKKQKPEASMDRHQTRQAEVVDKTECQGMPLAATTLLLTRCAL